MWLGFNILIKNKLSNNKFLRMALANLVEILYVLFHYSHFVMNEQINRSV